jgi:Tfp pilus assembly protein PilF
LEVEPNNVAVQHILATVWDMLKKYVQCDSLYELILSNNPKDIVAMNNYAYSLSVRGEKLDKALKMVEAALAEEADNASYLDTKGWILFQQKKHKEALKFIQKSLEIEPDNAEVLEHLGDIYQALRQPEKARVYYQRAAEIDTTNADLQRKAHP